MTATKAATKPAVIKVEVKAAKPTATSKVAAKATPSATPVPVQHAGPKLAYLLSDSIRPAAGVHLFAHTAAFFALSGMKAGAAIPRSLVIKGIGATALGYHVKNGNLADTASGIVLANAAHFFANAKRPVSASLEAQYLAVLSTDALSNETAPKVSSASFKHAV